MTYYTNENVKKLVKIKNFRFDENFIDKAVDGKNIKCQGFLNLTFKSLKVYVELIQS